MVAESVLTFTLIIVAGFLPALLWLWLILKEDRVHPEPRMRLILSFLGGMMSVVAVIPLQILLVQAYSQQPFLTIGLAAIEEIAKFAFAYYFALKTFDADEPVDEIIYMVTTALGFAALENSLFLAAPILDGNYLNGLLIAHARFLGSTLVHVAGSGIIGIALARTFYKKNKTGTLLLGLIIATALHSLYNLLIINNDKSSIALAFSGLWFICIVLIYVVNHVKHTIYKTI